MALHAYRNHACDSDLGSGFMYEVAEKVSWLYTEL